MGNKKNIYIYEMFFLNIWQKIWKKWCKICKKNHEIYEGDLKNIG